MFWIVILTLSVCGNSAVGCTYHSITTTVVLQKRSRSLTSLVDGLPQLCLFLTCLVVTCQGSSCYSKWLLVSHQASSRIQWACLPQCHESYYHFISPRNIPTIWSFLNSIQPNSWNLVTCCFFMHHASRHTIVGQWTRRNVADPCSQA